MFIITQKEFLAVGIVLCLYWKLDLLIYVTSGEKLLNKSKVRNEFIKLIFFMYIVGVISKVYFPLTVAWGEYINFKNPVIRLNPISSILIIYNDGGMKSVIYNLGGNLLLLMPMGFFIGYYFRNIFNNMKRILIAIFLVSLFIESTQVVLSLILPNVYRFFEINDLICNTVGGCLGYYLFKIRNRVEFFSDNFV